MPIILSLIAAAGLAGGTPPAPAPLPTPQGVRVPYEAAHCSVEPVAAETDQPRAGVHRLSDEPNARVLLTVFRTIDGCVKPVIVREDIGARR